MRKLILSAVATAMLTVTGASANESPLDNISLKLSAGNKGYYSVESTYLDYLDSKHNLSIDYTKFSNDVKQGRLILSNYDFSFVASELLAVIPSIDFVYNLHKTDESYFEETADPHVQKEVKKQNSKKKLRPGIGFDIVGISYFDTNIHLQNAQNYSFEIESHINEIFLFENKFLNALSVGYRHTKVEDETFNKFFLSYKF